MNRITVTAGLALPLAALAACQPGATDQANNQAAPPVVATPSPTPTASPTPRSIMQPDVQPTPTPTPAPLEPETVTIGFPSGGVKLDDAARAALDALAVDRVVASGGPIVLRGSSDSHGNDDDNRRVSRARAQAVADYLAIKGIATDRMTVIALGEDRPIAPNANLDGSDNPEGRARNRRVDITVTPGAAPVPAATPTPAPSASPAPIRAEPAQRQPP